MASCPEVDQFQHRGIAAGAGDADRGAPLRIGKLGIGPLGHQRLDRLHLPGFGGEQQRGGAVLAPHVMGHAEIERPADRSGVALDGGGKQVGGLRPCRIGNGEAVELPLLLAPGCHVAGGAIVLILGIGRDAAGKQRLQHRRPVEPRGIAEQARAEAVEIGAGLDQLQRDGVVLGTDGIARGDAAVVLLLGVRICAHREQAFGQRAETLARRLHQRRLAGEIVRGIHRDTRRIQQA